MREKLLKLVNETKLAALTGAVEDQVQQATAEIAASRGAAIATNAADPASQAIGRLEGLGQLARQIRVS
jgi:hypothetical protein